MKDPTITLLRPDQVSELKEERAEYAHVLSDPFLRRKVKSPAAMANRMRQIDHQLATYAPEPLPVKERDKVAARIRELAERIRVGMPTEEEMRKNAVGTLHQHQQWERPSNKRDILEWKNLRRQQEPESTDPDLANVERLRSPGQMDRLRTDAQIPGMMTYGSVPQDHWDQTFEPHIDRPADEPVSPPETSDVTTGESADARKARIALERRERMLLNRLNFKGVADPAPPAKGSGTEATTEGTE